MANVAVAGTEVAGGVVLQVLFAERARDDTSLGTRHLGALHVPCCAPSRTRPSPADLARLRPLLRAHQAACAAQEEALDVQRLSSTFAPLMQLLREFLTDTIVSLTTTHVRRKLRLRASCLHSLGADGVPHHFRVSSSALASSASCDPR